MFKFRRARSRNNPVDDDDDEPMTGTGRSSTRTHPVTTQPCPSSHYGPGNKSNPSLRNLAGNTQNKQACGDASETEATEAWTMNDIASSGSSDSAASGERGDYFTDDEGELVRVPEIFSRRINNNTSRCGERP